jgi:D-amino peptidase
MTRLLIVADMEGISGIERYEQCARSHPDYPTGVELLCREINVIAGAALSHGVTSVSVIDWHGGGGNVDGDLLDERVEVIAEDLSAGFDLAFLVGFHPMAGDKSGFISHTMTQGISVEIGDRRVGEIALISWWLGEHGIPVGMVTGDRAATAEADRFSIDVPTLTVKRADSWARATCIPVDQAYEALRIRVSRVLEQAGRWHVYRPESPVKFRIRFRDDCPTARLIPWLDEQADGSLVGGASKMRDLIDLIDVISALMSLQRRNDQISRLQAHPEAATVLDRLALDDIKAAVERGAWEIA